MAPAQKTVAEMTDDEVLAATDNGRFGPALVGKELHERSQRIMRDTGGGMFGPAITDPDYAKKQAAKRAAAARRDDEDGDDDDLEPHDAGGDHDDDDDDVDDEAESQFTGEVDPANLADPRNPWYYVTLGGAKMLAQQKGVSYQPRVKRAELIAALQAANIAPPPPPANPDAED